MNMMLLEDCCEILDSMRIPIKASDRKEGLYPYYGANGIQDHVADFIFDDELVLLAEDGGNFGSRERPIAYRVSGKCWVNNHAHVLKPKNDSLDVDYLCYSLMFYNTAGLVNGATRQKLTQATMREMLIPMRSIEEQKHIIEMLNRVVEIKFHRQNELVKLDELIKARFVEMFGDPVSNTKGWKRVIIDECVDSIENGKSFVCDSMARIGEEPAILKLSAATYGVYKPEENKAIINESDFIEGAEVHSGDLLFTRKNTPELVGMAAYVFMTPKKLMMPDLIFRINTKQNCRKIYLWKLINHELFRSQIQNLASGSAKLMPNISKERLGKLHICLPPLDLQIEFEKFVVQINKSKVAVQKALDETQLLFDSLMQKYFG